MKQVLSLQKLDSSKSVQLKKASGLSMNCKSKSGASWFAC